MTRKKSTPTKVPAPKPSQPPKEKPNSLFSLPIKLSVLVVVLLIAASAVYQVALKKEKSTPSLYQWIKHNGITLKAELDFETRELRASKDLSAKEVIASIPGHLMITKSKLASHPRLKAIQKWPNEFDEEIFVVWLLQERKEIKSQFHGFLQALPADYPNHPLRWTDEELQASIGTGIDTYVSVTHASLRASYRALRSLLDEDTYEDFVWAYLTITTKHIVLSPSKGVQQIAFVPVSDLFAFKFNDGATISFDKNGAILLSADKDYPKGAVLHLAAGCLTSYTSLTEYGFYEDDNPCNSISLTTTLQENPVLNQLSASEYRPGQDFGRVSFEFHESTFPHALFRAFRFMFVTPEELPIVHKAVHGLPLSFENERRVYHSAIQGLQSMANTFETTVSFDSQLLDDDSLSQNMRNAILYRRASKKILQSLSTLLTQKWEDHLIRRQLEGGISF